MLLFPPTFLTRKYKWRVSDSYMSVLRLFERYEKSWARFTCLSGMWISTYNFDMWTFGTRSIFSPVGKMFDYFPCTAILFPRFCGLFSCHFWRLKKSNFELPDFFGLTTFKSLFSISKSLEQTLFSFFWNFELTSFIPVGLMTFSNNSRYHYSKYHIYGEKTEVHSTSTIVLWGTTGRPSLMMNIVWDHLVWLIPRVTWVVSCCCELTVGMEFSQLPKALFSEES